MINNFKIWIKENTERLEKKDINIIEVVESTLTINNPSIRVDNTTKSHYGRITLWESGDTDIEILDIDSSDTVCYEHFTVNDSNFEIYFEKYFNSL